MSDALLIANELIANPQVLADLKAAAEGLDKLGDEIKDLSLAEGIDLAQCSYDQVKKVLAAKA